MIEKLVFVIRRRFWYDGDESRQEWLSGIVEPGEPIVEPAEITWSANPQDALEYDTLMVYQVALAHGGHPFLRCPSGKELYVTLEDFSYPQAGEKL